MRGGRAVPGGGSRRADPPEGSRARTTLPHPRFRGGKPSSASPYKREEKGGRIAQGCSCRGSPTRTTLPHPRFRGGKPSSTSPYKREEKGGRIAQGCSCRGSRARTTLPHPRFRGGKPSSASPYKGEEKNTVIDTKIANDTMSPRPSLRERKAGPYNRQFVRREPRTSMIPKEQEHA